MATLATVGVEVQTSAAQQAINKLQKSFEDFAKTSDTATSSVEDGFNKATKQQELFVNAAGKVVDAQGRFVKATGISTDGLRRYEGAVKSAGDGLDKFADETEKAKRQQEEFESGANRLLKVLGAGALLASVKQYTGSIIQLGQSTQSAIAANSTLAKDANAVNEAFRELTKELNYSTNSLELNQAAYDVFSAGVTETADVLNVMRAGVLGAKGGFSDLATVTDAVTTIMNSFNKSSEEAQKIVDMMIATQNDGKIVAAEYGQQIGVVASAAATAGVQLEELNAAVALATVSGVQVSSTFSGLRQAISSIASPSDQAKKMAEQLGIEFDQQAIKSKGFAGVLRDVAEATQGNAEQIADLFSSVEARAVIDPILSNLDRYNQMLTNQTQVAGAAEEATRKLGDRLETAQAQFANVRKEVEIDIFRTIEPAVTALTNTFTLLAKGFVSLPEPIQKVAIGVGVFATAMVAATAAMVGFNAAGITKAVVLGGLQKALALTLTPFGLITAAVTAAYLVFQQMMQSSEKLREVMSTAMERMGDSVGKIFDSLGRAVNALTGQYAKHEKESKGIFESFGDWFAVFADDTIKKFELMAAASEQFAIAMERAAGVGLVEGVSLTEIQKSGSTVKIGNTMTLFEYEIGRAEKKLAELEALAQKHRNSGGNIIQQRTEDEIKKLKKDIRATWQGWDRLNETLFKMQNPQRPKPNSSNQDGSEGGSGSIGGSGSGSGSGSGTAIADRREQEFREQQQRERAAFDDRQRFEELSFDQRADYELRLFDLQTRHQELLRQERLDTESEIARAVIESQRKIEDYQRQIERRRLERQFRQQQQLLQIQNLQQQQAFGQSQANSAVSFGTGQSAGQVVARTGGANSQPKETRGRSSGAHLHAQSKTSGLSESQIRALMDKYVRVDGRTPSSFGESRASAGHGYTAIDYLTPQGSNLTLLGNARLEFYSKGGDGGLMAKVVTPEGTVELGHLLEGPTKSGSTSASPGSGVGAVSDLQIQGQINQLRFDELTAAQEMLLEQQELLKLYEDQADIVPRMVRENVKGLQEQTKQMEIESKLLRLRGEEKRQYLAQLQYEEMYLGEKVELEKLIANTTNDAERAALQKAYNQLLKQEGEIRAAIAAGQFAEDQLRADRARFDWRKTQESMMDSETEATRQLERQLGLLKQSTEQRQQYLAMIKTEEAVQKQILELQREMDGENNAEINKAIDEIRASAPELYRFYLEQYRAQTALNKEIDYYNEQLRLSQAIADGIGDSFANAFGEFVMGTKSAQEAFASMMSSIANVFMQEFQRMVAQKAAAGLLGFITSIFLPDGMDSGSSNAAVSTFDVQPFSDAGLGSVVPVDALRAKPFADGGIVTKPMLGLVGEAGKEAIIPLDRLEGMGNNVTINVSVANDGSTTTDQQNANQLGRELETAVVAVLQKQKRPGGLLASVR